MKRDSDEDEVLSLQDDLQYDRPRISMDFAVYESVGDPFSGEDDTERGQRMFDGGTEIGHL